MSTPTSQSVSDEYRYSKFTRVFEGTFLLAGSVLLYVSASQITNAISLHRPVSAIVLMVPVALLFLFFSTHTQFPDLKISAEGLRVRIYWRWYLLPWNTVATEVHTRYFRLVTSPHLPFLYVLFGRAIWFGRRCFFINRSISNWEKLSAQLNLYT